MSPSVEHSARVMVIRKSRILYDTMNIITCYSGRMGMCIKCLKIIWRVGEDGLLCGTLRNVWRDYSQSGNSFFIMERTFSSEALWRLIKEVMTIMAS